jgi:hypothetical protein
MERRAKKGVSNRMFKLPKPLEGSLLLFLMMSGYGSAAVAAPPLLTPPQAQDLATAAAQLTSIDTHSFAIWGDAKFNAVTRVWLVNFLSKDTNTYRKLRVFVYDASSRTEVTCVGLGLGVEMETTSLPPDVQPFVFAGEVATDLECADLNGDGRPDYLLVTQTPITRLAGQGPVAGKRVLQIILRQPNGALVSAFRNEAIISPYSSSYEIIARRNKFSIMNEQGGSGGGDFETAYFEYADNGHTWMLTRAIKKLWGGGQAESERDGTWTQKDFGRVTVSEFKPESIFF